MTPPEVVQAGIPALGTMLVIAGVALVLGLTALWLSRRHTHREAATREDATREAATRESEARESEAREAATRDPATRPSPRDPGEVG